MKHTNGCLINTQVGGDHAHCKCPCHEGLTAIPPSRERVPIGAQTMHLDLSYQFVTHDEVIVYDVNYNEDVAVAKSVKLAWFIVNACNSYHSLIDELFIRDRKAKVNLAFGVLIGVVIAGTLALLL